MGMQMLGKILQTQDCDTFFISIYKNNSVIATISSTKISDILKYIDTFEEIYNFDYFTFEDLVNKNKKEFSDCCEAISYIEKYYVEVN